MKSLDFGRYVLGGFAVAAMLAGCGGSQPPISAPGAMPQSRAIATPAKHGGSWMLPEAKSEDLLYVVMSRGGIDVLSYPGYQKVGELWSDREDFGPITSNPINGNILINVGATVYEYAHGGKQPIAEIAPQESRGTAVDYAFDPTTDNIAISFQQPGGGGMVDIFETPSGDPTTYSAPNIAYPAFLGYDNEGNLFVQGRSSPNGSWVFAELPKNGSAFADITLNETLSYMGTVQWDGTYITIASGNTIYQVQVSGSNGTIVGTTSLTRAWTRHPLFWIQGDTVIGDYVSANHEHNGRSLGLWNYPAGGKAVKVITGLSDSKKDRVASEAVSIAP